VPDLSADLPLAAKLRPLSADDVRAALGRAATRVCYQPIVSIADRRPTGLEALARLHRDGFGFMAPQRFVPLAEAAGMARPLTIAVAETVARHWEVHDLADLGVTVAINVPLDVMAAADAMAAVTEVMDDAAIPASRIVFELTESRPIYRLAELAAAVERLRRAGYSVAIDDVGPDGRDCTALLALPFTALKLDRALVNASGRCSAAADALAATAGAAHSAGMRVIAEGVEDTAGWDRMAKLGADEVQGFLVGRPMFAASLEDWMGGWAASGRRAARPYALESASARC
jgi:EAL domain-containing protein (putative c-di-GMP-specific phosphodiesterase class I)